MNICSNGVTKLDTPTVGTVTSFLRALAYPNGPPKTTHIIPTQTLNNPCSKLSAIPTQTSSQNDEVDRYLSLPRILPTSDPLEFWAQNKSIFPNLSNLAKQFLAIPATTAGPERLFSSTGSLARARRSSLMPVTLENMVLHKQHRLPTLIKKNGNRLKSRKRTIATDKIASKIMHDKNDKTEEIVDW